MKNLIYFLSDFFNVLHEQQHIFNCLFLNILFANYSVKFYLIPLLFLLYYFYENMKNFATKKKFSEFNHL